MQVFLKILETLSRKGKIIWAASVALGILASILEVASAATFSLLTSSLFGGRKSNFGILAKSLPFTITQAVLISILGVIFISKLAFQWIELNFFTLDLLAASTNRAVAKPLNAKAETGSVLQSFAFIPAAWIIKSTPSQLRSSTASSSHTIFDTSACGNQSGDAIE